MGRARSFIGTHGFTAATALILAVVAFGVLDAGLVGDVVAIAIAAAAALYVRRLRAHIDGLRRTVGELRAGLVERADQIAGYERARRTDGVTGLGNRRHLEAALPRLVAEASSSMSSLAVLVLELEGFARFGEAHGDQETDRRLKALTADWQAHMRINDVLVRVATSEFVAVLPACSPPNARRVASRLASTTPAELRCSVGVASWDGNENFEQLLRRAESATRSADAGREPGFVAD